MATEENEGEVQHVIVMRHGHRLDDIEPDWRSGVAEPWNPPLSDRGKGEVERVTPDLKPFLVQQMFVSPFLRCLQTAAIIAAHLEQPSLEVVVDPALSEVFSEKLLFGQERDTDAANLTEWMCHEDDACNAWERAGGTGRIQLSQNSFPSYPESLEDAHARYSAAFEAITNGARDGNVLIVTHGEAVRRSVTWIQPMAIVYEVEHRGWTAAWRTRDEDGDWGEWHLEGPVPSRGVAWM